MQFGWKNRWKSGSMSSKCRNYAILFAIAWHFSQMSIEVTKWEPLARMLWMAYSWWKRTVDGKRSLFLVEGPNLFRMTHPIHIKHSFIILIWTRTPKLTWAKRPFFSKKKNVSVVKLESTLSWYTIYQLETWLTWVVLWLNFTELYWMLPHFPVSNKFIHGKWLNQWLHNRPNSWNESVI